MIAKELQVYKDTYKFVRLVANVQKDYSKQFKYVLGAKTLDTALLLFEYIQQANMFRDNRRMYLNGFIVKFETLKTLLRLADDFHQININIKLNYVNNKFILITTGSKVRERCNDAIYKRYRL
jgi:hypothetical protein